MNSSIRSRSRGVLLAGAAATLLMVSGCGDDSTTDGSAGEAAPAEGDGIVTTREIEDFGTVLADAEGNTLYTTTAEDDGSVKCVDGCADFWPPLEADADSAPSSVDGVSGEFAVVTRPDGTDQLTLDGNPLYTFADDTGPGSFVGDGFEDDFQGTHFVWHAVTVDGSAPAPDQDSGEYNY